MKNYNIGWKNLLEVTAEEAGAVEVAVSDGFHDVVVEDVGGAFEVGDGAGEVGDGAGDFEDAVVGSGRHVHAFHGVAHGLTIIRTRMARSYLC